MGDKSLERGQVPAVFQPPDNSEPRDAVAESKRWAIHDTPTRQRLLRRLETGQICGEISRITGRPCQAMPIYLHGKCLKHASNAHNPAYPPLDPVAAKLIASNPFAQVIKDVLTPEAARLFDTFFAQPAGLETEIAIARVRLADLERQYAEGKIKDSIYQMRWRVQMDALRKLVDTNQKVRLREEAIRKLQTDPFAGEDAYDPVRDAMADDPPDSDPEGGEDSAE